VGARTTASVGVGDQRILAPVAEWATDKEEQRDTDTDDKGETTTMSRIEKSSDRATAGYMGICTRQYWGAVLRGKP
jgi:hypothetical protein